MPARFRIGYAAIMVGNAPSSIVSVIAMFCGLTAIVAPAQAKAGAHARLVHCGADTCLRLSGHRPGATTAIRIGGRALAVEGGRTWQATVPLATARTWPIARGYALRLILADSTSGLERTESVMLPPGALGSHLELASLVVSGR